jgi:YgiT-type zinc finger domain-containing protein
METGFEEEMEDMKCVMCKNGETSAGTTSVALERGGTTIVIKQVPAEVCDNCAEGYLSDEISTRVMEIAESAAARGAEIEVLRFIA